MGSMPCDYRPCIVSVWSRLQVFDEVGKDAHGQVGRGSLLRGGPAEAAGGRLVLQVEAGIGLLAPVEVLAGEAGVAGRAIVAPEAAGDHLDEVGKAIAENLVEVRGAHQFEISIDVGQPG